MNNTNKTTRLFYTARTTDDIRIPACLEFEGTWEEADAFLARQMICQNIPIASVRQPFKSRGEVESFVAEHERRLAALPEIKILEGVRAAFGWVIRAARAELEGWV